MNEFTLISKYLKPLSIKNPGALKLSDDIYFDAEKGTAISVDTYVEGVHFIDSSNRVSGSRGCVCINSNIFDVLRQFFSINTDLMLAISLFVLSSIKLAIVPSEGFPLNILKCNLCKDPHAFTQNHNSGRPKHHAAATCPALGAK